MKRGFYGIAIFEPKTEENLGTILRSGMDFEVDFICTIGNRYKHQGSDTTKAYKHIPLYHYRDIDDFIEHIPQDCSLVTIEVNGIQQLEKMQHPERAIYILGGEDRSVPTDLMEKGISARINTRYCLNLAVAASIVMYDRNLKADVAEI